jgi:hypothetical protein
VACVWPTSLSPVYACDHLFKRASVPAHAPLEQDLLLFANAVRAKTSPADGSVTLGSYSPPASVRGPDSHKRFAPQAGSVAHPIGVSGNGQRVRGRVTGWRAVTPRRRDGVGDTVSTREDSARRVGGAPIRH